MADLRIADAAEKPTEEITGEEKLPTGGSGNYSITVDSLATFTVRKKNLATNQSVDNKVGVVRDELDAHAEDLINPHQVTKGQVGLGNVDNTADADKPVSNSTQAAIVTATQNKADKSYVDNKTHSSLVDRNSSDAHTSQSISFDSSDVYTKLKQNIPPEYDQSYAISIGGYPLHARIMLSDGQIAQNTLDGNTNNPNSITTGWIIGVSASIVKDANGNTQQEINNNQQIFNSAQQTLNTEYSIVSNGNFSLVANSSYPEFGAQSVGKVNNIPMRRYFTMRGYYAEKPTEYDWDVHGVRAWLDMNGVMQHSLKVSDFDIASKASNVVNLFVKKGGTTGTTNTGRDPANPLGAVYSAIRLINLESIENAVIWLYPDVYTDGAVWGANYAIKSNVSMKIWNGSVTAPYADTTDVKATITTETTGLTWTLVSTGVYSTARSAAGAIVDDNLINSLGDGTLYSKVTTLDECKTKASTWYQDGATLYVHTHNNRIPDSKLHVYVTKVNAEADSGNYTLFCERINFYGGDKVFNAHSALLASNEYLVFNKCSFKYGVGNNLESKGIKYCISVDCVNSYGGLDGFNYHTSTEQPTKITYNLEINCLTYQHGKYWSAALTSNNGTTIHDGCYIARFGTVTYQNEGPNVADVGGGKSWNFNCQSKDCLNPSVAGTHADFYTSDCKMWLDHCDSSGSNYSVSAIGNGRIYIRNCNLYARVFQGNKMINWNTSVIT